MRVFHLLKKKDKHSAAMSTPIKTEKADQSYRAIVRRQFRKNRLAVVSLRVVYVIFFIGIFADFIASEKPLYCKLNGTVHFPVILDYAVSMGISTMPPDLLNVEWLTADYESVIRAPIPYLPLTKD